MIEEDLGAHHPVIFRPLRRLQYDRPIGKVIRELVSHRMNVIVAHT
ncbi:MAG: Nif3-like dinuclear metal center hexameric protein, partial [Pseudomonas sp.]|nr:Nif3-like dinuclear metal center hexameric protein [Pseudomonas sp.]